MQSHASYSRCGLGSEATDRLVALTRKEMAEARAEGRPSALYGAKITGGGSGGSTAPTPLFPQNVYGGNETSAVATCMHFNQIKAVLGSPPLPLPTYPGRVLSA